MKNRSLNILLIVAVFFTTNILCSKLQAQIKVGNNPTSLNANAILEMEATNKGLLLPRLALTATTSASPLSSFDQGMFVFNTATIADVTPGIYYSDGVKWVKVSSSTALNNYWSLTGNAGTSAPTNFMGTTDNAPIVLKTNSLERLRITENGWVGIGTATPTATLQIKGQLVIDTLTSGNLATDSFLVANPANGRVKAVSASAFMGGVQKSYITATAGQTIFTTPASITDINKVSLYRNGVLIAATFNSSNSVLAEIACVAGDEIKIIQLL